MSPNCGSTRGLLAHVASDLVKARLFNRTAECLVSLEPVIADHETGHCQTDDRLNSLPESRRGYMAAGTAIHRQKRSLGVPQLSSFFTATVSLCLNQLNLLARRVSIPLAWGLTQTTSGGMVSKTLPPIFAVLAAVLGSISPAFANLIGVSSEGNLYSVSKTTASLTLIGNTGISNWADIQFAPNGTLYGFTTGTTAAFYTINPTTAASTLAGNLGIGLYSRAVWLFRQGEPSTAQMRAMRACPNCSHSISQAGQLQYSELFRERSAETSMVYSFAVPTDF